MEYPRKVYAIRHNITNRVYVGSSKNVEHRIKTHMSLLRARKHSVEDMQKDFDEYGDDFSITFIDDIYSKEDAKKEYEWMEKYHSNIRGIGYNYKDKFFSHCLNNLKKEIKAEEKMEKEETKRKSITDWEFDIPNNSVALIGNGKIFVRCFSPENMDFVMKMVDIILKTDPSAEIVRAQRQ